MLRVPLGFAIAESACLGRARRLCHAHIACGWRLAAAKRAKKKSMDLKRFWAVCARHVFVCLFLCVRCCARVLFRAAAGICAPARFVCVRARVCCVPVSIALHARNAGARTSATCRLRQPDAASLAQPRRLHRPRQQRITRSAQTATPILKASARRSSPSQTAAGGITASTTSPGPKPLKSSLTPTATLTRKLARSV